MKINWKVRIKNKMFWLTLVPAVMLLIQTIAALFGITIDLEDVQREIIEVINAVFVVLVIIGVVTDPTTNGVDDSDRAMSYDEPAE